MAKEMIKALEELKKDDSKSVSLGFKFLKKHYEAHEHSISMPRLHKEYENEVPNFNTVNLHYGKFASKISEITGIPKGKSDSGKEYWMKVIAIDKGIKDKNGFAQWTLKSEIILALEFLKLVEKKLLPYEEILEKEKEYSDHFEEKNDKKYVYSWKASRYKQGEFRERQLNYWNSCSVTGYENHKFLIASHIKPWKDCTPSEALVPVNGLLLIPNLDKAFDNGFISFDTKGEILISQFLSPSDLNHLNIKNEMKLRKDKYNKYFDSYMNYHRENVFNN